MAYALDSLQAASDESRSIRRIGFALALLAIPVFGVLAILSGKEAAWDFENYHWYDPYALLTGRLGFDLAVAHHATYYNPLPDVPLYWLGAHFPAWVVGLWLGAQMGAAAALIGAIAYRLIPLADKRARLLAAVVLTLAGMAGGGAVGEIGKTSDDILSALGILAALLVLSSGFSGVVRAGSMDRFAVLLPAGFLAGISPGLKLTTAPYAVGLAVALLLLPGSLGRRLVRTSIFGLGVLLGIAAFGGFWLWTMWRFSGNPVFPYFNDVLGSPLVPSGSFRDPTFLPNDWVTRLTFPFVFSLDSLKVAEWKFRDIHIAIAYVLVPLAGIVTLFGFRPHGRTVDPLAARMLLVMAAVTYIVWLSLFAIYRYVVPLEMLSPLIIAMAVAVLPLSENMRIGLAAVLLVAAQAFASPGSEERHGWAGRYVEAQIPPLDRPADTLILMAGSTPTAYLIPEFPPAIPFLRIQGYLIGSKDVTSGFGAEMHRRVSQHNGPIYALFWRQERPTAVEALTDYSLTIDDAGCRPVETNIQENWLNGLPIDLCPLTKMSP